MMPPTGARCELLTARIKNFDPRMILVLSTLKVSSSTALSTHQFNHYDCRCRRKGRTFTCCPRLRNASYSYAKRMYVEHITKCRGAQRLPLEERMVIVSPGWRSPISPPPGDRLVRHSPHLGAAFPPI